MARFRSAGPLLFLPLWEKPRDDGESRAGCRDHENPLVAEDAAGYGSNPS